MTARKGESKRRAKSSADRAAAPLEAGPWSTEWRDAVRKRIDESSEHELMTRILVGEMARAEFNRRTFIQRHQIAQRVKVPR